MQELIKFVLWGIAILITMGFVSLVTQMALFRYYHGNEIRRCTKCGRLQVKLSEGWLYMLGEKHKMSSDCVCKLFCKDDGIS